MSKILNVQKKIGKISKDKQNPYFKSSYFDINQLLEQLLPLLHEEGLTLEQPLSNVEGRPALRTLLLDEDGVLVDEVVPLPDLDDPQKMGSCITYYRRYALQSLFALQAEDDDGNKGAGNTTKEAEFDL